MKYIFLLLCIIFSSCEKDENSAPIHVYEKMDAIWDNEIDNFNSNNMKSVQLFNNYILPVLVEQKIVSEGLKQQGIDKYIKSKELPRKQKKKLKKEALLDYSIGCHAEELLDDCSLNSLF